MSNPEAIRLAEELEEFATSFTVRGCCGEAAVELRRLHRANEALLAALRRAADHISEITTAGGKYNGLCGDVVADSYREASAARKAIASVSAPADITESEGGEL